MTDILSEITPLSPSDCFYIVSRRKNCFNYPIHNHKELEINFIQGAAGAQRIVGDSIETISDMELVLVGSQHLEHTWSQGTCHNTDIWEITIQFLRELFSPELLSKNQFASIKTMLDKSALGIAFPQNVISKVNRQINQLTCVQDGFEQFLIFLDILYTLSRNPYRVLASTSFAHAEQTSTSRRIQRIKDFIDNHYTEEIRLDDIASMVDMSPSALSHFFKMRTGKALIDHLLDIRLGAASRALVDSTATVSEICYGCGFNNISNFNRAFKKSKGMTPSEFRYIYKKHKIIV